MLFRIVLIVCFFTGTLSFAQSHVKYQSRSLLRTLKKSGISSFSEIKEIKNAGALNESPMTMGKFYEVLPNNSRFKYIYVGRVNSCRAGGCSAPTLDGQNLTSEYFDYFILFNQQKAVLQVKVFNYQATHGHEITAKGWLKQFIGYNGTQSLAIDKDIDSISGATISVNAITSDIANQIQVLKQL
ncbi:FMN-binding protein [Prolixibacteraceae bacterium JC049]|nr:FMN-binding protein [Prolixibacteraceae bacterium JC049]